MGMYDCVKYKMDCPECGKKLDSFQSKDGKCMLAQIEFWEVNNFYDLCGNCGAWIEFNRIKPRKREPIKDYKLTVKKRDDT